MLTLQLIYLIGWAGVKSVVIWLTALLTTHLVFFSFCNTQRDKTVLHALQHPGWQEGLSREGGICFVLLCYWECIFLHLWMESEVFKRMCSARDCLFFYRL